MLSALRTHSGPCILQGLKELSPRNMLLFYADYYFHLRALEEQQVSGVPLSAKDRSSKKNSIVMHPSRGILSTRED